MKIRKVMSAMLAAEMLVQMAPAMSVTAYADSPAYDILVNGKSAADNLSVTYGSQLTFELTGAAEGDEVYFSYATEADAANDNWTTITDGVCTLEPGRYLLKYDIDTADGKGYSSSDTGIVYSMQVKKAKLAAPASLVWNGCNMGWSAVTATSTGESAEDGAVKGYTLSIYKNGALVGADYTETLGYVAFADSVLNNSNYGNGSYTFTVKAEVSDSAAAHYTSSDASEASSAYIVPLVTVRAGSGIAAVTPPESFLLLPGSSYASKEISASAAETYEFARWSGSGVTFTDDSAENTVVTINDDYSGADTLTITALSKDNAPPEILSLSTEGEKIKASAQDNEGVIKYAFSAAESADAVTEWLDADNLSDAVQSFDFEPTAGGRYRFFAQDASGNIAVSEDYIDVTMITYHDYSDGEGIFDKTAYFFGNTFNNLPVITRAAWVFGGWHTLADLSDEAVTEVSSDIENGVELYAKWTEQTLEIPALTPISKKYDSEEETLSVSISNTGVLTYQWYKDGSAIVGANSSSLTVKNVADSGSYSVFVELKQSDGTVIGSGSADAVSVEIAPAALTVKADDREITYGADAPESYSVTISGYVGEEGEEVITRGTVTCDYRKGSAAGGYDIVPSGFSADNYEIDHQKGTLTVKAKTGTLSAALANPDAEYYYSANTAHTPAVIVKDGDTLLTEGSDYKLEYTDNIKAGTATITVTYKGNYSGSETLHFVIKQSSISPVLKTADKVYGEPDKVVWLEGVPSDSGKITYYYAAADSEDYSTVQPTDAGSYKVYAEVAGTSDYVGFTTPVESFNITKRRIKITANSAVFPYDGTEHTDSGYEIEGTFVVGQGFKEVKVTGSVTDVTAPGNGVVNKITYVLSPTTNPDNYDIIAVDGLLEVTSISLTVPSGLGWSSTAGTASWVPVKKNNLLVNYALDLYAFDGNDYTKINDEQIIIDTNSYDFAPAIIAHAAAAAEQGKTYSYTFKIQTLSAGGSSMSGYTDSEVSDYQAMMYTAQVSLQSDSSMLTSADMGGSNDSLILLNGQSVAISASTKDGFVFDSPAVTSTEGFAVGTPNIQTPEAHKQSNLTASITAKLTSSQLGGVVTIHTVDEKPWISSFTAENSDDYQSVKLSFIAADGNNLAGWMITKSASAPAADDSGWNNLSGQGAAVYNGSQTVTEESTYYIYVKDGSGTVVTYPLSMSVYRISFDPGTGTGTMQSILKAQNTEIPLPDCTFTNDGFNFQNWIGNTGIYSDGGSYSANSNDLLVASWTDEHYDYTVRYFYMDADGNYSDTPESERTFNGVYGATITTASDDIQYARTGFELDNSAERTASIVLSGSGQELNVYYRRIKYNVYFKYTKPHDTEPTVKTVPYYYGADLSAAFVEKPSVAGYDFIGWLFGSAGTQPTEMPAHDVTVTGSFTPKSTKYHIRYFTQDVDAANRVCRDTYTPVDDIGEDIIALHDDPVVFGEDDAQRLDGFTFAGIYVTHGAAGGDTLPQLSDSVSETAVADTSGELYINVYYYRNSYSVKLNVWEDTVGVEGNLKYTYTWNIPYGASLDTDAYPVYNMANWPHSEEYELADYIDWSTGTAPSVMPAGDVTITRQFVSKVTGLYKVEVYLETENEGEYSKKTFTYYNNVGKSVSVGAGDSFTINYNNYANSIDYFQYYTFRSVTDEEIANNVIKGADGGTLTTGVVTNTNNGQEPLVMRIFFERKTCRSTINYYYNDGTSNDAGTLCYTIVKESKWGNNHKYNYEPLALFDSTFNLNETSNIVS